MGKNGRKYYVAKYTDAMIKLFERTLRAGYPENHPYFCDERRLEIYGSAIGSLDRDYMVSHVLPSIRNSCWERLGESKVEQIVAKLY